MVPLSDALIFSLAGLSIALVAWLTRSRWAVALGSLRALFPLGVCPALDLSGAEHPGVLGSAIGLAFRITGPILRRPEAFRRIMLVSLPALLGLVAVLWAVGPVSERITERTNPPARPGSPNVLFIVLDTVRAESLSLHGYGRPTSRFLEGLRARAFVSTRRGRRLPGRSLRTPPCSRAGCRTSCSPAWTARSTTASRRSPSSCATTDTTRRASSRTRSSAADGSGLARGFVHYEDVAIDLDEIVRTSGLGRALSRKLRPAGNDRPTADFERKDAKSINAEFLAWLDRRPVGTPVLRLPELL